MTDKTFTINFPRDLTIELEGADFKEALFAGRSRLAYADLAHKDLQQAKLQNAMLEGANLRGADLRFADLRGANLKRADLRDAQLGLADLTGANLTGTAMYGAKARGADFSNALLIGTDMRKVDLTNAKMDSAIIRSARLPGQQRGQRVCTIDTHHGDLRVRYYLYYDASTNRFRACLDDDAPMELPDFAATLTHRLTGAHLAEAVDIVAFFQARAKTLTAPLV